mmetsp:Transcript_19228/g.48104  ORF Transcript_19228/g.48104 Transcript_19228/m.48104 type:complete len:362 (-) Transcript_19228:692-1777(-)
MLFHPYRSDSLRFLHHRTWSERAEELLLALPLLSDVLQERVEEALALRATWGRRHCCRATFSGTTISSGARRCRSTIFHLDKRRFTTSFSTLSFSALSFSTRFTFFRLVTFSTSISFLFSRFVFRGIHVCFHCFPDGPLVGELRRHAHHLLAHPPHGFVPGALAADLLQRFVPELFDQQLELRFHVLPPVDRVVVLVHPFSGHRGHWVRVLVVVAAHPLQVVFHGRGVILIARRHSVQVVAQGRHIAAGKGVKRDSYRLLEVVNTSTVLEQFRRVFASPVLSVQFVHRLDSVVALAHEVVLRLYHQVPQPQLRRADQRPDFRVGRHQPPFDRVIVLRVEAAVARRLPRVQPRLCPGLQLLW